MPSEMGKILLFNHTGWLGGAELSLLRYLECTRIPRKRFLCIADREGPLCSELAARGYDRIPLDIPVPGLENDLADRIGSWVALAGVQRKLARIIGEERIDLMYANSHRGALILAPLRLLFPGIGMITHVRDRIPGGFKRNLVLRSSTQLIVISNFVRSFLEPIGSESVNVIPSGVDTDRFRANGGSGGVRHGLSIPPRAFVFGMFCQVLPWKGVREYVEAALIIISRCEDVYAMMLGDDSFSRQRRYFEDIKRRVRKAGMEHRILFPGFRQDVERYFADVDVVVSASREEPLGQTILQAMAMQKPVIAVRSGGPAEIVEHEKTGLLVDSRLPQDLAEAMQRLYDDREKGIAMGRAGKARFIERYLDTAGMARAIDRILLDNIRIRGAIS